MKIPRKILLEINKMANEQTNSIRGAHRAVCLMELKGRLKKL